MTGRPPARIVLTAREREVIDLVGRGQSYAEIAERLKISTAAVSRNAVSGTRKLVHRLTLQDDAGLSPREREVIDLLAEGLGDGEIASRLGIGRRSAETLVGKVLAKTGRRRADISPLVRGTDRQGLTAREREVLELVRRGYTDARIAEELGIRRRTAESHVFRLLRKLGKSSRRDL